MEIDRKELKHQARERMALTDPKFWVVALAYLAMTTGVAWIINLIPFPAAGSALPFIDITETFLYLLLKLYTTVVAFGLCLWSLWTYRQLDPGLNSLMQGFSVAGRVVLMELGIFVRILGWYFLVSFVLSIPMIYFLFSGASYGLGMLSILVFAASLFATLIVLSLRYALAPYLLADRPDDGPSAPIYRSAQLMRGWKWELFKLEFSFIGWEAINFALSMAVVLFFLNQTGLLTIDVFLDENLFAQALDLVYSTPVAILSTLVTVPVSLWLLPYRATARAGFYDARMLASAQDIQRPEMPPL